MNADTFKYTFEEDLYAIRTKVLVCLPTPWAAIKPTEKELLKNILKAIKLTLDGVVLISGSEIKLDSIKIHNPFVMISFGCTMEPGIETLQATLGYEIQLIQTESLQNLIENKVNREKLWEMIQPIFQPTPR